MSLAPDNSNPKADAEQDPWVPSIIEHLRRDGHLPSLPLPEPRPRAWDRARVILQAVTAEHVFAAWQEIKMTRECDPRDPVLPLLVADFKDRLERWLNS